mmetsp:Transcript_4236/g.11948  ORF Transcript_4236/g.11948 Transcript_4236/m.11948 type:complete len:204 (-) Transcript_4236:740-1351(-)
MHSRGHRYTRHSGLVRYVTDPRSASDDNYRSTDHQALQSRLQLIQFKLNKHHEWQVDNSVQRMTAVNDGPPSSFTYWWWRERPLLSRHRAGSPMRLRSGWILPALLLLEKLVPRGLAEVVVEAAGVKWRPEARHRSPCSPRECASPGGATRSLTRRDPEALHRMSASLCSPWASALLPPHCRSWGQSCPRLQTLPRRGHQGAP